MTDDAEDRQSLPLGSQTPTTSALIGRTLGGRYRVEALIGEGGMGAVFRSEHVTLRKIVAIKLLTAAADAAMRERFLQEARVAATLKHSGIAEVYDFGLTDDGLPYYAMEYLEGTDLEHRLAGRGPLPASDAVAIAREVAQALAAAHAAGVVHRDLKPANIFLVPQAQGGEIVKVVDFGISKVAASSTAASVSNPTMTGLIAGTPFYMSPEQAGGRPVDNRSDIYALGVVLYEMLCGRPPFDQMEIVRVLNAHLCTLPPPLSEKCPCLAVPQPLEALVMRALEKDPERRFTSMSEFDAALAALGLLAPGRAAAGRAVNGSGAIAAPPADGERYTARDTGTTARLSKFLYLVIGVSAVVLLLVAGTVIWFALSAPPTAAEIPATTPATATHPAHAGQPPDTAVTAAIQAALPESSAAPVIDAGKSTSSVLPRKKPAASRPAASPGSTSPDAAGPTPKYGLDDLKPYGKQK